MIQSHTTSTRRRSPSAKKTSPKRLPPANSASVWVDVAESPKRATLSCAVDHNPVATSYISTVLEAKEVFDDNPPANMAKLLTDVAARYARPSLSCAVDHASGAGAPARAALAIPAAMATGSSQSRPYDRKVTKDAVKATSERVYGDEAVAEARWEEWHAGAAAM